MPIMEKINKSVCQCETVSCHTDAIDEFAPVRSRCTLDLSAAAFSQSDAFSRMMETAHEFAVRANYCYR